MKRILAAFAVSALLAGCSSDVFHDLQPGDCVREKGLGLTFEGGIERIDCSEHAVGPGGSNTWIVKAVGTHQSAEFNARCPQFGVVITDGDYGVCFYAGR